MSEFDAFLDLMSMLLLDLRTLVPFALLVVAAIQDWSTFRISNALTFGGTAFALLYALFATPSPLGGLATWAGGLATGLGLLMPLYLIRVMGAGDVKLMGMAGSFLGASATLTAVLFTFVVGGLAALALGLWRRRLVQLLANTKDAAMGLAMARAVGMRPDARLMTLESVGKLPYGVCICIGTIASVVARQLGYL